MTKVIIVSDAAELAREAAQRFTQLAIEAVAERGRFSVALSGGSTSVPLYRQLAEQPDQVPWERVHLFWGDERSVPPNHPDSNFRLAEEALISHVPIPACNVHRVQGELQPEAAAPAYAAAIHAFFGEIWPRFDLVLLGLGNDGHTASLFPGSPALRETARPVVAVMANYQDRPAHRVTLTLPAINAGHQILFLATGAAKAEIVAAVLQEPNGNFPAQLIQPAAGQLTWLLDAPAASRLTATPLQSGG